MKIRNFMVMLVLPLMVVGLTVPTTANASSWKKGTPKAVRGEWMTSKDKMPWTAFGAKKKSFTVGHMGMTGLLISHSSYKHSNSTYTLKGYAKADGMWLGGTVMCKLVKKGHHLHIKGTKGIYYNATLYKYKISN